MMVLNPHSDYHTHLTFPFCLVTEHIVRHDICFRLILFLRQFKCALLIFVHFSLVYWIKVIFCVLLSRSGKWKKIWQLRDLWFKCDVSPCWISYSWRDCNWNGPIIHFIVEFPCFSRAFRSERFIDFKSFETFVI